MRITWICVLLKYSPIYGSVWKNRASEMALKIPIEGQFTVFIGVFSLSLKLKKKKFKNFLLILFPHKFFSKNLSSFPKKTSELLKILSNLIRILSKFVKILLSKLMWLNLWWPKFKYNSVNAPTSPIPYHRMCLALFTKYIYLCNNIYVMISKTVCMFRRPK